eukprot:TRINITY_DN1211_c0_g2_i3.p1 TRINITY_DN1211_c0_g2~~TRINITY_DN1211_c0_g2_i3.p1  ORF type:complete len:267 (+),score=72.51 TRINITY_DN1211_c0_g2_i3:23-802(+)
MPSFVMSQQQQHQQGLLLRGCSANVSVKYVSDLILGCLTPFQLHMVSNTVRNRKDMVYRFKSCGGVSIECAREILRSRLGDQVVEVKVIRLNEQEKKETRVPMVQVHCTHDTKWTSKDTKKIVELFELYSGHTVGQKDFQLGKKKKKAGPTHIRTIYIRMDSSDTAVDVANPYNPCMDAVAHTLASGETVYLSTVQTSPKPDVFIHENNASATPQIEAVSEQVEAVSEQVEAVSEQVAQSVPNTWRWNPYSVYAYEYLY